MVDYKIDKENQVIVAKFSDFSTLKDKLNKKGLRKDYKFEGVTDKKIMGFIKVKLVVTQLMNLMKSMVKLYH